MNPGQQQPQAALMNSSVVVSWSNGDPFTGFMLVGLVLPTGGSAYLTADINYEYPSEALPLFTRIPIFGGAFDTASGVLYNSSISPPNTKYCVWYYDSTGRQIAGPSTLVTVSSTPWTPPSLTLTAPTAGVTPPTPN